MDKNVLFEMYDRKLKEVGRENERVFGQFTNKDYRVVYLDEIEKIDSSPTGIAQAIINASENGQKPVNLKLREGDFLKRFAAERDWNVYLALTQLGSRVASQRKPSGNALYYFLEKTDKPPLANRT